MNERQITDVLEQARQEGVDLLAVPLGGGTGPFPDAYSVTLKVTQRDFFFFTSKQILLEYMHGKGGLLS